MAARFCHYGVCEGPEGPPYSCQIGQQGEGSPDKQNGGCPVSGPVQGDQGTAGADPGFLKGGGPGADTGFFTSTHPPPLGGGCACGHIVRVTSSDLRKIEKHPHLLDPPPHVKKPTSWPKRGGPDPLDPPPPGSATELWSYALTRGITVTADHLPGDQNLVADQGVENVFGLHCLETGSMGVQGAGGQVGVQSRWTCLPID